MNRNVAWIALVGLVVGGLAISGCKKKEHKAAPAAGTATTKPAESPEPAAPEPAKTVEPAAPATPEPAKTTEPAAPATPATPATPEPAKTPEPAAPATPATPAAPEPAKPAAGDKVKTPWFDAKVGDSLKFKGMGDSTQTFEVTAVDDDNATVNITVAMPNLPGSPQQMKMPRYAPAAVTPPPATPDVKTEIKDLGTEDITVSGKKLTCKVTQMTMTDKDNKQTVSKTWICPDVLGGTVKAEVGGQVMMELVEINKK